MVCFFLNGCVITEHSGIFISSEEISANTSFKQEGEPQLIMVCPFCKGRIELQNAKDDFVMCDGCKQLVNLDSKDKEVKNILKKLEEKKTPLI